MNCSYCCCCFYNPFCCKLFDFVVLVVVMWMIVVSSFDLLWINVFVLFLFFINLSFLNILARTIRRRPKIYRSPPISFTLALDYWRIVYLYMAHVFC